MGREVRTAGIPEFRFLRILAALMIFVAGGVVLTIAEPPTGRANAATVAAPSGDPAGVCTQTVSTISGVAVAKSGETCVVTFSSPWSSSNTWTIPSGIRTFSFVVTAPAGGAGIAGDGGRVTGTLDISSVSSPTLYLNPGNSARVAADMRLGSTTLGSRVVVAGAGGGCGLDDNGSTCGTAGGAGGGNQTGGSPSRTVDGESGQTQVPYGGGGGGGSTTGGAGGAGQSGGQCGAMQSGSAGSLGSGGAGGWHASSVCAKGGDGGAGYYGGGGGGGTSVSTSSIEAGGGGGGGSSWTDATYVPDSGLVYQRGVNASTTGTIQLTYTPSASSVTVQPSGGLVGAVLATQPTVSLTLGSSPAPAGVVVTAALGTSPPPSGLQNAPAIAGTLTATTNASGVATFTDLKINGPTGAYTLSFSATGYPTATSSSLTLTVGAASALKVSTQPSTSVSGGVVAGSPAVTVVDAGGNAVTTHPATAVTVTSSTGTIGGTTTSTTSSGVATFTAATLTGLIAPTNHTLTFAASGLGSVTSSNFNVTVGAAAALSIQTQPGDATSIGTALSTQPVVRVVDAAGNVRTSDSSTLITATIASGSGSASLTNNTRTATSGAATFSGLAVTAAGGNFTLTFAATGLTPVTSSSFGVGVAGTGVCQQTFSDTRFITVLGPTAGVCTITFDYGIIPRTWTVPAGGLTNVSFTIRGGAGGGATAGTRVQTRGAEFSGTIASLAGGESVHVYVADGGACPGSYPSGGTWGGSWGGGGAGNNGSCRGGGSTDIRIGGTSAGFKKIVAGGGGGNSNASGCPSGGSYPGCAHGQDANGAGGGARGYWHTVPFCWGGDGAAHDPNYPDQWGSGIGGDASSCRNAGSGGGGYAGGGGGSNISGGNDGGDGGRGSSFIQSGFAVASTTSQWTGTGSNAGTGTNNSYAMYTNYANAGQLVVSFPTSTSSVTTQPSGGQVGAAFGTQPAVTLETGGSPAAGVVVTAALGTSPSASGLQISPVLAGTVTATTNASGVATFTDLKINGPTGAYTLSFSATGYPTATSSSFTLTVGAASALKVSTQPTGGASGGVVTGSPAVTVVDAGGNAVTTHPATMVTVSSATGTIGGTLTATTSSGVATFTAATLTGLIAPTNHTLTFAASGLTSATSSNFNLTVGAAAALSITTQPVGGVAIGAALGTQPVVKVVDSGGNVVSTAPTVTATIASGSSFASLGSDFISASSGVATFSGLKVNGAGGNFTLTFSAPGLASVTSSSFSISLTSQTITFGALTGKTFGDAAFGISASTTSNLVIAYSSTTPAVCSVAGNTTASAGATGAVVTLLGAGTCTIATNQAGNHVYSAAGQQTRSFSVAQAAQSTLTLTNASSVTFGDTLTLKTSGGSGTGAVSYALVGGAGTAQCTLNATTGAMTFGAAGTCSVRATKAADTNYTVISSSTRVLTVARAPQTTSITSSVPAKPLPGGDYTVTATASSGLTPTVALMGGAGTVCSLTGSKISFLTAGTCVVIATQAGNGNYLPADPEDMQTIVVGSLNQSINFAQPANMEFGDPDVTLNPAASSGLPVTLTSETATVCTVSANKVSIVTVGRCELKAAQAGNAKYAAASDEVRVFDIVAVVANSPTISSASASSGAITVNFTSPSFDGGAAITGYRLTATPTAGGTTVSDNSCVTAPCTLNGLENGIEYTVTVAALNEAGTGSASTPSPALTPVTNAMAVQGLVSTPGDATLAVSWTTPADLGGGTFTRYEVRLRTVGGSWPMTATQNVASQATTSLTLTGLDNGTEYEVQVVTITSANAESFEGNTAVVSAVPRRVPSSPRELTASRLAPRSVVVSWSVPASNGGAPISSYTVTLSGGASCGTVAVSATTQAGSCTATGLSLDTTYTITVVAVNVAGSSSAVSTTYTTPSYPGEPAPPPTPPCASCIGEPFDGPNEPDTTPKDVKPGKITLTDGVVTVVLEAAAGTEAFVNADKQLEFALGGKLSAIGTGALATTTMATWWNRTATATGTVNASGGATVEITLPTGTTTGVASVRVDAVSSLGVQRAFYFAVKVVAAGSTNATTTNDVTSTGATTTTTTVPGSTDDTNLPVQNVDKPRKPKKSGTFEPESGESEMLSSTGKVSKAKTVKTSKGITIEGGGVKVGISPSKGTKMAKNTSGQMVVSGPGKLNVSKSGLKPGSKVVVWLRPSMKRLAVAKVKADGTIDLDVALPDDLPAGDHLLQIDMVNADGEQVSMATGFSMSASRMPVTGSEPSGGATPAVLMVLLGAGLLLGRRRLRTSPSL